MGFTGERQVLLLAFEDKSQRYCYVFYKTQAPATASSFSHHHYPNSLSKKPMVQRLKTLIYSIKYRHLVPLSSTSKKKKILESLVKHLIVTYLKKNKQIKKEPVSWKVLQIATVTVNIFSVLNCFSELQWQMKLFHFSALQGQMKLIHFWLPPPPALSQHLHNL